MTSCFIQSCVIMKCVLKGLTALYLQLKMVWIFFASDFWVKRKIPDYFCTKACMWYSLYTPMSLKNLQLVEIALLSTHSILR